MAQSKKPLWSDIALKMESFYTTHYGSLQRAANLGRIWGTHVEDLRRPVGVAGRVMRSVPELISLLRTLDWKTALTRAMDIVQYEMPHVILGSVAEDLEDGLYRNQSYTRVNPNASQTLSVLKGLSVVLNLKTETLPLTHEHDNSVEIEIFKVYLDSDTMLGILHMPKQKSLSSPLFSTHDLETTRAKLTALWSNQRIAGFNIVKSGSESEPDCHITQIASDVDLVVGTDFANDYQQIAARMVRFEKAGYRRNLMLLGPPGCGKTSIAQQIAQHIGRLTINVDSQILASSLLQIITAFFHHSILICDDFDRYHGDTQALLASLEKIGASLIVTCNTIYGFDKAAVRVGRIDEIINVPMPDEIMRARLIQHFAKQASGQRVPEEHMTQMVLRMVEFTPAEIREATKCYLVLGFEDCLLEIERIRRQSKIAESLWYKLDWTGMTQEQVRTLQQTRFAKSAAQPTRTPEDEDEDEDD